MSVIKKYSAFIRNNATGEVREQKYDDLEWYEVNDAEGTLGSLWWWTEGNFGCDCNRYLEFERAAGNEPDFDKAECGDEAYSVLKVILEDGREIQIDGNPLLSGW